MNLKGIHIVIVEDDHSSLILLDSILTKHGFGTKTYSDAETAWTGLHEDCVMPDLILLDRVMPGRDGIELLRQIRTDQKLQAVPVILQTSLCEPANYVEGFHAGASGYLAKPINVEVMLSMVTAITKLERERRRFIRTTESCFNVMQLASEARFKYQTIDHAQTMAILIGRACPRSEYASLGLIELFMNAIEHGNLEIGFKEKGNLLEAGKWEDEIKARLSLPKYQSRFAEILFEQSPNAISVQVTDQGNGFDWEKYLYFDFERAFDLHGRGIASAKALYLDDIQYIGKGNQVRAIIKL